jgi:glycosyltransferase involved in cell wall biosynthesis
VRPSFLIPIYDHGRTIRDVVKSLEAHALPCLIVDDGSGEPTARALAALEREFDWVVVRRLPENRGKGAAISRGLALAADLGFTHAITMDADGQHDTGDVPRFLEASRADPSALVLGEPVFDESVPTARRIGRRLSCVLVQVETLSRAIHDPLCGFRSIPVAPALEILASARLGQHMEFDPELAVRMVNAGARVVNLPTLVRYPAGGTSHFQMFRDNVRISWFHTRLLAVMLSRLPKRLLGRTTRHG